MNCQKTARRVRHFPFPTWLPHLVLCAMLCSGSQPAWALNIILNFDSGQSESPGFDSDRSLLMAQMQYAESFFQGVFQDSHTITINYWYEDLDGLLGQHTLLTEGGAPHRETEANVRIDTKVGLGGAERDWFVDASPSNNSEFDMQQTFWRDLSGGQQTDWYTVSSGTVPETYESAYTGTATDAAAIGRSDMLSVVFQEIGHALGMSAANDATITETNDGDYDFNPSFVFGTSLAGETNNDSGDDNLDIAHLENPDTVMSGSIGSGRRVLPSHSDLFAMASGSSFTSLDVPRREFYGNSNWQNSNNWSGNEVPETGDDVYIRDAQGSGTTLTAGLNANGVAANLFISEGARADTNGFKLDVGGDVTVTDLSSRVFINPSGELEADEVFIQNTAQIRMSGGTLDARRIVIDDGASLEGFGAGSATIQVDDLLRNNGLIDVDESGGVGSTLTFVATSAASPWDLDGTSGDGFVLANGGDIFFNSGSMSDNFDGEIEVGAGYRFHFANSWTNSTGLLDLNGGTTFAERARITGGTITFTGGDINANVGSTAAIAHINPAIVISGGTVIVGLDDHLELNGATTINGGTFSMSSGSEIQIDGAVTFNGGATFNMTGTTTSDSLLELNGATDWSGGTTTFNNGVVQQDSGATVSTDTTVNAGVYDLDGLFGTTTWTINKTFTLTADQVDTSNNVFNGTMDINNPGILLIGSTTGGALALTLPGSDEWTMFGTTNVDGSVSGIFTTITPSIFQGSPVNITGTLNVQDRAGSSARVDLSGDITTADADSLFRLTGGTLADPNRILGGQVTGSGKLTASASRALVGFGTVATTIDFDGDAELRADDGTLIINGSLLVDVGTIGTADTDGVLSVTGSWNTNAADQVELQGGSIVGGTITNGTALLPGLITGFGTVAPSGIINDGTIAASGGTLIVNTVSAPDLDGGSGDGVLEAINGNLTVTDAVTDFFDGTATVGATRTMAFSGGWTLGTGTLNLNGGASAANRALLSGTVQTLRGTVNVSGEGHFNIPTDFTNFVQVNLPNSGDTLRVFQDSSVRSGATFSGDGTLVNVAGATMTIDNGASIGVALLNAGDIEIGSSPGSATVGSYSQTVLGRLGIELGGTTAGSQYDQLIVSSAATLGGLLDVTLINLFAPGLGDSFNVLFASGGVSGTFGSVNLPGLSLGLFWDIDYSANLVTLDIIDYLLGDMNGDLVVDLIDVPLFVQALVNRSAYETNLFPINADVNGDVNEDGMFDLGDLAAFNFLFTGTSSGSTHAVPEPPAILFALLALASLLAQRRSAASPTTR